MGGHEQPQHVAVYALPREHALQLLAVRVACPETGPEVREQQTEAAD